MVDKRVAPILKVLERLPISAVIASPLSGRIIWVNSHNIGMAGATHPGDLLGKSILDFIDPSQHGIALRDVAAVAIGQSPPPVTYRLKRLDGGSADGQISSVPLIYEGKPAMLSLIAEVTECESAMRALRDSEERYRLLVESLPEGLTVVVDDTIVFANPGLAALLGYASPDAIVGASLYDFVHPDSRKEVRAVRRRSLLEKKAPEPYRVDLLRAGGDCLPALITTALIRWEGHLATQTVVRPLDAERA